ncbi:oligoendopeptidase F [Treponema endosymbiont of Eucomonympha sp.]|uniref:oligoendopeptidase F n=1 Tax=Treponema endosymbiont of Eucomonympha sp. TaxID=1580831 RepID=UPI0007508BE0|nr:oligoendopeptidase F [Treponema endosymbiont of Eucomonympha sp.]
MKQNRIPERDGVPPSDKWNLASLFSSDGEWEQALSALPALAGRVSAFKGTLAGSKERLLGALAASCELDERAENVGCYASLLNAGDAGDRRYQEMLSRYTMAAAACAAECSFLPPEIQALPEGAVAEWLALPEFADYRVMLAKLLRMKPHILGEKEERLLALQAESAQTAEKAFSLLTNADLDFGSVSAPEGELPLTQSTWAAFMERPERGLRRDAYLQFYRVFERHKHTLAALYEGSVSQDIFEARARGYPSALDMALFPDSVPLAVYENLVQTVRANLAPLHRYYALRKSLLGIDELRHYDVYVPLVPSAQKHTSYEEAVELIREALAPLGGEYTDALCAGLLSGWTDRYENKGKRAGAFSSGAYRSSPYILLNYKADVLRDVFTVAHEGGHSMHTLYSARANPFPNYRYTIFEAEVASTCNEELLFRYLLRRAGSEAEKRYLVSMRAQDILATLYRQTMFAEFELRTHRMVESGEPLSADALRACYRSLLGDYFGPALALEAESDLECLRIPHFYHAFYVYKYATGISAALALAERISSGDARALDAYFAFLKSGGSRYPIDSLALAGVDMRSPAPVQEALSRFAGLAGEMEAWGVRQ